MRVGAAVLVFLRCRPRVYDAALLSQSSRVSIVVFFFFSFLFFSVSLPMASQGRSLVFSAILIETHSSSVVRSKKKEQKSKWFGLVWVE